MFICSSISNAYGNKSKKSFSSTVLVSRTVDEKLFLLCSAELQLQYIAALRPHVQRNNFGAHLAPLAALWHATSLVITRRLLGSSSSGNDWRHSSRDGVRAWNEHCTERVKQRAEKTVGGNGGPAFISLRQSPRTAKVPAAAVAGVDELLHISAHPSSLTLTRQ